MYTSTSFMVTAIDSFDNYFAFILLVHHIRSSVETRLQQVFDIFLAQINNPCLSPHLVLTYNPGCC